MKKKTIYYWSPFLTDVATSKAVINSAYSIQRYYKEYESYIIDAVGEFTKKFEEINFKKINLIKLNNFNLIPYLPKYGKLKSRFSFLIIFITSFFSLKKILSKDKPDFLIIHLITILPLCLLFFFNFQTKCILRISGFPIMSPLRKFLWSILLKKVYIVSCPTKKTLLYLKSLNIVDNKKLKLLYDPAISIREIARKNKEKIENYNDQLIAIGRLTNQKNFKFLIDNFKDINQIDKNLKLSIFGEGEQKKFLENRIKKYELSKFINLRSFKENIFPFIKKSKCLILTSFWEDPGFVLLEAAACRTFIISSNCNNGPSEILDNNAGLLFETNDNGDFLRVFNRFLNLSSDEIKIKKLNALKKAKLFSIFNHSKELHNILKNI